MNSSFAFILLATMLWGIWGFFAKLATQKIGPSAVLFNAISFFITILTFVILVGHFSSFKKDSLGIIFAIIAGICSGLASAIFYVVIHKNPVGIMVAITALYPLITILLSMIVLKETLTITKMLGIFLGTLALALLALT